MIKKAKLIKEIHDEVKDYSLVITTDAPLRTALDRLINKPFLGVQAMTPKEIAGKHAYRIFNRPVMSEVEAIIEVSRKLNMDIRETHHYSEMIFTLWENIGDSDKLWDFLNEEGKSVLRLLKDMPIIQLAMERFDNSLISSEKIAVIGLDFFNELDKSVLPKTYSEIDIFTNDDYILPNFYGFYSEKELVDYVVSIIEKKDQDNIAIILDPKSSYLALIRSKLINKGIEVNVKEEVKDHFQVRIFMSLIDIGLNPIDLTVKEISHFADIFSFNIDDGYNGYLLTEYMSTLNDDQKSNEFLEFYDLIYNITDKTYKTLVDLLMSKKNILPDEFIEIIHYLGLMDKKIDLESFMELEYYIRNFDIEIARKKQGVLMIDCGNSVFVDRAVCFFIGLDSTWVRDVNIDHIDKIKQDKNNLASFQILLQQGELRYYFVSTMKDNQPVIPCYYFNILYERNIDRFDRDEIFNTKMIHNKELIFENQRDKDNIDIERDMDTYFSQTTLNKFITCPKQYMYNRLVHTEEHESFLKGNLFHEYASFYLEYNHIAREKGEDFFVDFMIQEFKRIGDEMNIDIEQSKFRIGLDCLHSLINGYLDKINQNISLFSIYKEKGSKNRFLDLLELKGENKNSEINFRDNELHIEGKIDVMVNEVTIIDYKSSNQEKRPSEIIGKSILQLIDNEVDFQPIMYILEMRRNNPGNIEFIYDFFLSNHRDIIKGTASPNANLVTVKYYDMDFNDFLKTQEGIELLASSSKTRLKVMEKIGYDMLIRFFMENPMPRELQFDTKYEKIFNSEYRNNFVKYACRFADIKDKEVDDILKGIILLRKGLSTNTALYFKDDIDEFEDFLIDKYNELLSYLNDTFPCKPLTKENCDKCEYMDICTKAY